MPKIYCYSLDFHKKEKEFENIDELLKDIVGAKEQATNALNNPELSYRGFRLISEDKLNVLLPQILKTKSEKIKGDYVNNIADLEGKIKKLEKSERKSSVKMDVLKDDHLAEVKELTEKSKKEKDDLNKKYSDDILKLEKESDDKIKLLTENYLKDVDKINKERDSDVETLKNKVDVYTKNLRKEISEYNKKLAILKDNHNAQVDKIQEQKEDEYRKILSNKELISNKLKYNLNDLTKTVSELTEIINKMILNENEEMDTRNPLISLENVRKLKSVTKPSNKYEPLNKDNILNTSIKLSIEPLMITSTLDTDDVPLKKDIKLETNVIKDTTKEKIENKVEIPKKVIEINGHELMENKKYENLSTEDKVFYLLKIRPNISDLPKMCKEYPTLEKDLNNRIFLKSLIGESRKQHLKYVDIKDLVKEDIAKNLSQTVILSRAEYNKYFGIVDVVEKPVIESTIPAVKNKQETVDTVESIIEQDRKKVTENKEISFDWETFKSKYVRTEEMRLLFSRESISLREASVTITVPSNQIKLMMGTLKTLNYNRRFNNPNLLTPDELLLFIVSDGWYKASIKRNSEESLQKILKKLYPSWLEFTDKK